MGKTEEDAETAKRTRFDAVKRELRKAQRPLILALRDVGCVVNSVYDFVNGPTPAAAIPILIEHFTYDYPYVIREGIARSLTVKGAPPEVKEMFIKEYLALPGSRDVIDRIYFKMFLDIAIGYFAKKKDVDRLIDIALDERHGPARFSIIFAIFRKDKERAGDICVRLTDQPEALVAAIAGLGRLRDPRAMLIAENTVKRLRKPLEFEENELLRVCKQYLKRIG